MSICDFDRARTSSFIYVIQSYDGKIDRLLTKFLQNLYTITLSSGCSCKSNNSSLKSVYSRSGFCISVASSYNTMGQ